MILPTSLVNFVSPSPPKGPYVFSLVRIVNDVKPDTVLGPTITGTFPNHPSICVIYSLGSSISICTRTTNFDQEKTILVNQAAHVADRPMHSVSINGGI